MQIDRQSHKTRGMALVVVVVVDDRLLNNGAAVNCSLLRTEKKRDRHARSSVPGIVHRILWNKIPPQRMDSLWRVCVYVSGLPTSPPENNDAHRHDRTQKTKPKQKWSPHSWPLIIHGRRNQIQWKKGGSETDSKNKMYPHVNNLAHDNNNNNK